MISSWYNSARSLPYAVFSSWKQVFIFLRSLMPSFSKTLFTAILICSLFSSLSSPVYFWHAMMPCSIWLSMFWMEYCYSIDSIINFHNAQLIVCAIIDPRYISEINVSPRSTRKIPRESSFIICIVSSASFRINLININSYNNLLVSLDLIILALCAKLWAPAI